MKAMALTLTALSLFVLPGVVSAQDQWETMVRDQLKTMAEVYESDGYAMTHNVYVGSLDDGGKEDVELDLDSGWEYEIIGACDQDCSDIDLVLYAGSEQIDDDVADDDKPIVTARVIRSGSFHVEVQMADCSQEPCRFGIGVWGKRIASSTQATGRMTRVGGTQSSQSPSTTSSSGSEPNIQADPTYGTVTLKAGFDPDPYERTIAAGGADEVDLGISECSGFINAEAPDLDLDYEAGDFPLHIYAKASTDVTLVVNQPDGTWICSDDANGTNPVITLRDPQSGNYNIWIGTFEPSANPLPESTVYISETAPR